MNLRLYSSATLDDADRNFKDITDPTIQLRLLQDLIGTLQRKEQPL